MAKKISNFLRGVGSIFVLMPPSHTTRYQTDRDALSSDWKAVGNDIRQAIDQFKAETNLDGKRTETKTS